MKNKILWGVTYASIGTLCTAECFLDSENQSPFIVAIVLSLAWLSIFFGVNNDAI